MSSKPIAPSTPAPDPRPENFHPLEIIPYFRRFESSLARDLLYTLIWSSAIGAIFWTMGAVFAPGRTSVRDLGWTLLFSNVIGYTIHGLFVLGDRTGLERRARAAGSALSVLYFSGVSTIGVLVGFNLVAIAIDMRAIQWLFQPR